MNGLSTYAEIFASGGLFVILILTFLIIFLTSWWRTSKSKSDRLYRYKIALARTSAVILLLISGLAILRHFIMENDISAAKFSRETSLSGDYFAEYAYLPRDKILLRLYDAHSKSLLTERLYDYQDKIRLAWTKNSLIYDTSAEGDNGEIKLPPGFWDKFKANYLYW
ncbi:hypothetical protein [Burkholderia plantarii]|uniref:hypothetical protein n=1 Tax=Burkholderia plantarii TaxID=41899 RepID=UPI0018DD1425|nr:hypothetical protein [Burkholderia plantarii]MBI0329604.1 hypothetical protein [Burkholderia plantarii]